MAVGRTLGHHNGLDKGYRSGVTDVIAHRGASAAEAENTIAAFRRAVAMGADGVELDVRTTADGVLVVHHDAVLADGRTIAAVAATDLPATVTTLAAALDACSGLTVNVELKNDPHEPDFDPGEERVERVVVELGGRAEPLDRWLVSSFRMESIDRVAALRPDIATAYLTVSTSSEQLDDVVRRGHVAVHPFDAALTEALVAAAHSRGLRVNVWTCNDAVRAQELAGWGVDGIITDVPDVILEALGRPRRA